MSFIRTVSGNPTTVQIAYSESPTRERESRAVWDHLGTALYTLKRVFVTFTTDNGYYWCKIYSKSDNRYITRSGSVGDGGTASIDLYDTYQEGKISDTITIAFRRNANYGCTYRNIQLNLEYEANAEPSTVSVSPAIAGEPQTVNISNTNNVVYHNVTWSYGSSIAYATFGAIISGIDSLHLNGNVEIWNRPRVSAQDMIAAGYTDFDPDSYATLYSMTYTTENDTYTVLMTPITASGTVYSQSSMDSYFATITASAASVEAIVSADASSRKLVIHAMSGEHISDMDYIANACHNLSEQWEDAVDLYGRPTKEDVTAHAVSSGPIRYGAATRSPAWAVPSQYLESLYDLCRNSNTIPTCVFVETFMPGDYSVGITNSKGYYLAIPNNSTTAPTVTITLTSTQDQVGQDSGVDYLQYHTTIRVTPNGVGKIGATIVGASVTTPDGTFNASNNTATSILIKEYGNYPVQVAVIDSRGFTATATYSPEIVVTQYTPPVITYLTAERCLESGRLDDEGTYIQVEAKASKTASSWSYTIVQTGHSTVIERGNLDSTGKGRIGNGNLDKDTGYTVTVTATCEYTQQITASINVASALYTFHRMAGGKGVAFGQVSDRYGVEVTPDWPFYTHGKEIQELLLDYAHPVGSIIQTISDTFNPNTLWPWTHWSKLEDVFLLGSGSAHRLLEIGGAESGTVNFDINIDEQPYYIKPDNLPQYTYVQSYTGKRIVANKLANSGSAYRYFNSDPDPLFTMKFGAPQFVVRYETLSAKAYVVGDYTYRVSGETRVYYRCLVPVPSGTAWNAGAWEVVQYDDIKSEIATEIEWEGTTKIPPGGFAEGEYGFIMVDSKPKLYRCLQSVSAYGAWTGDAERYFAEVPYGDAKTSATISTMPPYLTVNIWVRAQ